MSESGLHSNGLSLGRTLFGEDKSALETYDPRRGARPIDVLLTPTRIYVRTILSLIERVKVKGIAHITGGGFIENIPRIFPKGLGIAIDTESYPLPRVFKALGELAGIEKRKMYNTFNMGIGLVLAVDPAIAADVVKAAEKLGDKAYGIGKVTGNEGVEL